MRENDSTEVKQTRSAGASFFSSYAFKLGLTFVILLMGCTSASLFFVYNQTKPLLLGQMGSRLADIGRTASHLFGEGEFLAISRVLGSIEEAQRRQTVIVPPALPGEYRKTLPDDVARLIINSPDYQLLHRVLVKIKDSSMSGVNPSLKKLLGTMASEDKPTLAFVSLFSSVAGDSERRVAQFIVDSDYDDPEAPAPPGNLLFNNSDALRRAFDGSVAADPDFRFEQGMHILTAAIPLRDSHGKQHAVLSLYYDAGGEVNYVSRLYYNCLAIVGAALLVALFFAFLLTWFLTRDIRTLTLGAERVRNCDFSVSIDLRRSDELGMLASTFNEMTKEIKRYSVGLQETNTAYARFVPKQILQFLGQNSITDIRLGDQVQRQMTILFADIRSFTTISESMSPRDNFDFINQYLRTIGPIIRKYNGFIDKYIGDAIMALFPDRPEDAVRAAIEMQGALVEFNVEGKELGRPAVTIGVGIHRGNLMLGTVGEEERMDGTVISDAVNLTSRLEGLTKQFGAPIIISEAVLESIQGKRHFEERYLGEIKVKGKQRSVKIFEVIDGEVINIARRKAIYVKEFERAVRYFEKGEFAHAGRLFSDVLKRNRGDMAAKMYQQRCKESAPRISRSSEVIKVEKERFRRRS